MQLSLTQIGEEIRQIEQDLDVDWLTRTLSGKHTTDFRVQSGHSVQFSVKRVGLDVYLSAQCTLRLQTDCAACLKEFELEVPVVFSLTLKPRPQSGAGLPDEMELSKDDLEESFYEGDVIDLDEILREQIILALPMYPRCTPECRGLCPVCGVDLNKESCDCQKDDVDPRLAVLKTLTKH